VFVGLALGVATSRAGRADTTTAATTTTPAVVVTVRVVSVVNQDGVLAVTLSCLAGATCRATYELPPLQPDPLTFTIAAGARKTYRPMIAGPLHASARTLKTIRVVIVQGAATSDRSYPLAQGSRAGGAADHPNGPVGPTISAGQATRLQVVRDPRGDNRSSFPLPKP